MSGINKGNIAAIVALVVLAGVGGWRFLTLDESDGELAQRADPAVSTPPSIADLRARAQADPGDAVAWYDLGMALFGANRFAEAAEAFERAVAADGDAAQLWSALGEARVMASRSDPLPAPALAAFRRALELDGSDARARYFLAVEKDLAGDHEGAIADWLALLADTPPGAPWETDLVRTIRQVAAINQIDVEDRIAEAAATRDLLPANALAAPTRGPTPEQMAAAASLSPDQQRQMAQGMVERLASRIEEQGGSVQEWVMLMRSYQQMGRLGQARRTRDAAIAAHPDAADQINDVAGQLGIE